MESNTEIKDEFTQTIPFPKEVVDNELMEGLKKIKKDAETSVKVNSVDLREIQENLTIKIKEEFQIIVQDIKNDLQNQVQALKEEFQIGIKDIQNDFQNKVEESRKTVINMGHALKLDIEINAARLKQSFEKMEKNVNFDHKIMAEMVHKQLDLGIRAFKDKHEVDKLQEILQIGIKDLKQALAIGINSNIQKINSLEVKLLGSMDFIDLIPDVDLDQFYCSSEYINCNKTSGQQQLHTACILGRLDVAKKLINNGIRTYIKDSNGVTPLHNASKCGHLSVVKYLINVNAPIDLQTKAGDTALIYASWKGHRSIVEYLCLKKAKVDIKNINNSTALSVASGKDKNEIIKILKNYGAKV